jgi:imidazolonepropionase
MGIRLHADEFNDSGAAELAGQMKAHSADHLMAVSDKGIKALNEGNVVATVLPGTTVFLGKKLFAPVDKMVANGVRVALATDFNPGSCTFTSQPLMMALAMQYGKLSLENAFKAVTRNAALSLGKEDTGIIGE